MQQREVLKFVENLAYVKSLYKLLLCFVFDNFKMDHNGQCNLDATN